MNKRKWLLLLLVCLTVAIAVWVIFIRPNSLNTAAIDAVPAKPLLVFAPTHQSLPASDWGASLGDWPMLQELTGQSAVMQLLLSDSGVWKIKQDEPVLLAAYNAGNAEPELLMVLQIKGGFRWKLAKHLPAIDGELPEIQSRQSSVIVVLDLLYPTSQIQLTAAYINGVVAISTSSFLVESAIQSVLHKSGVAADKGYQRLNAQMKESKAASLLLYIPEWSALLAQRWDERFELPFLELRKYMGWVALEIQAYDGHIAFTGYAASSDDTGNENLFQYLQGTANASGLAEKFPPGTMYYWERVAGNPPHIIFPELISNEESEYANIWKEWAGNEWAGGIAFGTNGDWPAKSVFFMETTDGELAINALHALSDNVQREYRSYAYAWMPHSDVLGKLAGFSDSVYYALIGKHVAFASNFNQLKACIDADLSKRSLAQRASFKEALPLLLSTWNQFFYFDLSKLNELNPYNDDINFQHVSDQYGTLMIQLNPFNDLFVLHGFLLKSTEEKNETYGSWVTEADAPVVSGPFIVENQLLQTQAVVVQDSLGFLYLINAEGELQWKRELQGVIQGEVRVVDFYGNSKYQLLLNAGTGIYLIDMNGNDVEGFPIRLSSPVTSDLAVIDYIGDGEYRMFAGCENEKIYGFYKNGKPLSGWKPLKAGGIPATGVIHNLSQGKDYLAYTTYGGKLFVKNRKGQDRMTTITIPERLLVEPVYNRDKEASELMFITETGELERIELSGKKTTTKLADQIHAAAIADVDGDGLKDIIYLNSTGLFAVNVNNEVLYTFDPGDPMAYTIQLLRGAEGPLVGITSLIAGNSYMLGKDGKPIHSEPIPAAGKMAFLVDPIPMVVVMNGSLVQSFTFE